MGKLSEHREPIKAIIAASSGLGKTGSIWSLAAAGFKIKIYDCDRGAPIIRSALKAAGREDAIANVEINTFTEKMISTSTGFSKPDGKEKKAWVRFLDALNKWPDNPEEGPQTWGTDTVMVVDSLTLLGRHALAHAQVINNTAGKKAAWTDYGDAQAQLQSMMGMLYSDYVGCHVLYLTHVSVERDNDGNFLGAFPSSVGKALNEVMPRYVNNTLSIRRVGIGASSKLMLSTVPTENRINTKTEELAVKKEYELAAGAIPKPGLAEFFADLGWPGPGK